MNKTSVTKYKNGKVVSVTYPEPPLPKSKRRSKNTDGKSNSTNKEDKQVSQEDQ